LRWLTLLAASWEFSGYDHRMRDARGISHLDNVMHRIAGWVASKLNGSTEVCSP
jgi:hypothetical protein